MTVRFVNAPEFVLTKLETTPSFRYYLVAIRVLYLYCCVSEFDRCIAEDTLIQLRN